MYLEVCICYLDSCGLLELCCNICKLVLSWGWVFYELEVLIIVGCMEVMVFSLCVLIWLGDIVAISDLVYFGILCFMEVFGLKVLLLFFGGLLGIIMYVFWEVMVLGCVKVVVFIFNFNNFNGVLFFILDKEIIVGMAVRY